MGRNRAGVARWVGWKRGIPRLLDYDSTPGGAPGTDGIAESADSQAENIQAGPEIPNRPGSKDVNLFAHAGIVYFLRLLGILPQP